jgi:hypothetical protein
MVREAGLAGLVFNEERMKKMRCLDDRKEGEIAPDETFDPPETVGNLVPPDAKPSAFKADFLEAATHSRLHDCLKFNNGLSVPGVMGWWLLEVFPFKRMELQKDGFWRPVRLPLPFGECRNVPDDAKIHSSVLRRMDVDPNYRPGNLIVGGGGRAPRNAPAEMGTGDWMSAEGKGDLVGETLKRKKKDNSSGGEEGLADGENMNVNTNGH